MMHRRLASALAIALLSAGVSGCSGDSDAEPLNTDYSQLRLAESRDVKMVQVSAPEDVLRPLRNGLRLMTTNSGMPPEIAGLNAPDSGAASFSRTTEQVEGVEEADLVKYDGEYIFAVRPQTVPASIAPAPGFTRNVLKIVRTDAQNAEVELVSEFELEGEQSTLPQLYRIGAEDETSYIAAISQSFQGWFGPQPQLSSLVVQPDRTTLQLLDVRDPHNVAQVWKVEFDGWLRASRKIGDVLYLVNSWRPRMSGLDLPADTLAKRENNERRVLRATAGELLPSYRENDGAARGLASPNDCVLPADLQTHEAYVDLIVITAIDLNARRISDVACLSTNVNGVYVSQNALYVGGEGDGPSANFAPYTIVHKFALDEDEIEYLASGSVTGRIGWANASYYMDEHEDDLRIVTTAPMLNGHDQHRLTVLREAPGQSLAMISTLPNPQHPAPIGKPGEQVHAVRFASDRAYVVTAQTFDPLYVIDLADPADPLIAGELEIPGVSTYLKPIGALGSERLLAVGRQLSAQGVAQGVKVELFDVSDITSPRSLGAHVFGHEGSSSEAVSNPHALTFLELEDNARLALPIDVFDTPHPTDPSRYLWRYSGVHLLEAAELSTESPVLRFHGVVKTDERSGTHDFPTYAIPNRSVLHDDSVFVIHGGEVIAERWSTATAQF